jgi:hypothetical protein
LRGVDSDSFKELVLGNKVNFLNLKYSPKLIFSHFNHIHSKCSRIDSNLIAPRLYCLSTINQWIKFNLTTQTSTPIDYNFRSETNVHNFVSGIKNMTVRVCFILLCCFSVVDWSVFSSLSVREEPVWLGLILLVCQFAVYSYICSTL